MIPCLHETPGRFRSTEYRGNVGIKYNAGGKAMIKNGMRPVHPGEILREDYLLPLSMSAHALAKALHVPASRINDVILERRAVTADTAMRLSRYFDTTPQFWLGLQMEYDLRVVQKEKEKQIAAEVKPRRVA
jgi:addiction module HigA family antidote